MSSAIALEGIRLRYAGRLVIDGLSLSVEPGEVLTLLGPSGSGKTSVLRVILGFATPETGTVSVAGNLAFGLESKGVPRPEREARIRAMLGRVALAGKEHTYPGQLSGGERQRVAIARALVLDPRAVLLDEPLSNLDVGLKRELLAVFRDLLKEHRTTALYVTHDLREAAALGDRIAVMEQGRLVQEGSLDSLRARPASSFVRGLLDDLAWSGMNAIT